MREWDLQKGLLGLVLNPLGIFLLLNKIHYNMSFYIREGEENGKAYHFVTKEAMEAAICKNNFKLYFLNI